ncbi:MAG: alkaline phosphatase family protein [Bryobacteraceae bacterium]
MKRKIHLGHLAIFGCLSTIGVSTLHADFFQDLFNDFKTKRVLLISVDGMHSLDLANYIASNPNSTLALLTQNGYNYTNAASTKPSDSIPGTAGYVTGGTPAVTGMYYDDAYNRKWSPPGSACATVGAVVDLKQGIDKFPTLLDSGGIDPAKLPLDPSKGCTPVYPHNMLRVNTIFEVIKATRQRTAYSEKRPAYDFLNGPSGIGVDDLYVPEIAFDNTLTDNLKTKNFDELRVVSILNQITGKDHTGTVTAVVPAIFGMNFQIINAAKKNVPGAYTDSLSTPSVTMTDALNYVDNSLGRMVTELKNKNLFNSTAIIITAKHGETALDPSRRQIVLTSVIPAIVNGVQAGLAAKITQKANAYIWLTDQTKTAAVVAALTQPSNQSLAGIGQVLSGASLKLLFPDPLLDPAVPDIVVVANTGVNYEPSFSSTVLAEHGGFGENDTHVPLLVAIPGVGKKTVTVPVQTIQIAPTILGLLRISPQKLEAVRLQGTDVLPLISFLPWVD